MTEPGPESDRLSEEPTDPTDRGDTSVPAGLPSRLAALLLDLILLLLLFTFFVTQVVFPVWFPGMTGELLDAWEHFQDTGEVMPEDERLQRALNTINLISFFLFFLYFAFVPRLAGGGTLGQRVFNLRIENSDRGGPANQAGLVVRAVIKTMCLQVLFPLLTLLFLLALTNPRRRTLHDRFGHTVVVRGPAFRRDHSADSSPS